jgi:GDSL-like Lipase/Acylhydrolase family
MHARGSTPGKRRLGRVLAVLVGLVGAFALIEAALWTASLFATPEDRFARLAPEPGERRILCFGDSNTYGINLPAEASYPAQLGRMLDRDEGNPWRVVNLGYPGQNSAQVRARLAENLALYRPEVVIVWIGINNTWSLAMSHLWEVPDAEPQPGWAQRIAQRCRTLGMLRMLQHRVTRILRDDGRKVPGHDEVPGLGGALRGEGLGEGVEEVVRQSRVIQREDDYSVGLRIDLVRMRRICEEHGAKLCLVTYPIDVPFVREKVNPCIRDSAHESGTPLLDLEAELLPTFVRVGLPLMQFEDCHATATGNYETARVVLAGLVARGLLEPRPAWSDVPTVESTMRESRMEAVGREGRVVRLDIAGRPFAPYRMVIEARVSGGEGGTARIVPMRVREDSGLALEEQRAYFGRLSAEGSARADLALPEDARGLAIAAENGGGFLGWRLTGLIGRHAARGERDGQAVTLDLDPTGAASGGSR